MSKYRLKGLSEKFMCSYSLSSIYSLRCHNETYCLNAREIIKFSHAITISTITAVLYTKVITSARVTRKNKG